MQTQCFMHYISQEIDPKGKVNMHCSRHALIGLFGHCPEAKTHFTVSNPKHRFKHIKSRKCGDFGTGAGGCLSARDKSTKVWNTKCSIQKKEILISSVFWKPSDLFGGHRLQQNTPSFFSEDCCTIFFKSVSH